MSFKSMFQDVRDAVDWVHFKVAGDLRSDQSVILFFFFLKSEKSELKSLTFLGWRDCPEGIFTFSNIIWNRVLLSVGNSEGKNSGESGEICCERRKCAPLSWSLRAVSVSRWDVRGDSFPSVNLVPTAEAASAAQPHERSFQSVPGHQQWLQIHRCEFTDSAQLS